MTQTTIQTNSVNDLYLPDGRNLALLTGKPAAAQSVRQKTLLRAQEDVYNQTNGVRYLESIFTPQQDYDDARKSLIDNIMSVPDVTGIDSLVITVSANVFSYVANIVTIYGPMTIRSDA